MTPNEMRIVIAESVGWTWWFCKDLTSHIFVSPDTKPNPNGVYKWLQIDRPTSPLLEKISLYCPHYPNDLNAMHEVENTIEDEKFEDYWNILLSITISQAKHQRHWSDDVGWLCTTDATAYQRAKAYLLMKGLWKE